MRPSSILPSSYWSYVIQVCLQCVLGVVVAPTTVGALVGRAGPQHVWLPSPASFRGYQPLVGEDMFWSSWLWGPGIPTSVAP